MVIRELREAQLARQETGMEMDTVGVCSRPTSMCMQIHFAS